MKGFVFKFNLTLIVVLLFFIVFLIWQIGHSSDIITLEAFSQVILQHSSDLEGSKSPWDEGIRFWKLLKEIWVEFSKYLQGGGGRGGFRGNINWCHIALCLREQFLELKKGRPLLAPLFSSRLATLEEACRVMNGTKRVSDDAIANLTRCKVFSWLAFLSSFFVISFIMFPPAGPTDSPKVERQSWTQTPNVPHSQAWYWSPLMHWN